MTKEQKERAEQCIDNMLDFFYNVMELRLVLKRFRREGGNLFLRSETRVKVTTFMTKYLQSLGLVTGQEGKGGTGEQMQHPQRMRKKRAMVVFGGKETNVWETPLHDKIKGKLKNAATNDETTTKTTKETSVIDLSHSEPMVPVPTEDFAEKLYIMQSDFTSQSAEQSEEQKKTMESQEER